MTEEQKNINYAIKHYEQNIENELLFIEKLKKESEEIFLKACPKPEKYKKWFGKKWKDHIKYTKEQDLRLWDIKIEISKTKKRILNWKKELKYYMDKSK